LDDFVERRQAAEVAQRNVGHRPLAQPAQGRADLVVAGEFAVQRGLQLIFAERLLPGRGEFRDQFRPRLQQIGKVEAVRQGGLPAGIEGGVHELWWAAAPKGIECLLFRWNDCSDLSPSLAKRFYV